MNTKIFKNKNFLSIFLALIVFVIIFSLSLDLLNKNLQKYFNQDWNIDNRIVIIKIDDDTVWKLWRFPFDRKIYTNLIKNLNKAWATTIWFDIIFADKTNTWSDNELIKTIKDAWNIILWWGTLDKTTNWIFEKPIKDLVNSSLLLWTFDVSPDKLTNTVFSASPYRNFSNWYYEYFWISLLRAYYSYIFNDKTYLTDKIKTDNNFINIKDKIIIPLSYKSNSDILINFNTNSFKTFSFYDIYDDKQFSIQESLEWKNFLKDKIVLVWSTLRWVDVFKTPVWENFWVFVHAHFLNTVLTKNFSKYFDRELELLLIFLVTILAIYLNLNKGWKFLIISNIAIIWIIFAYFSILKNLRLVSNFPFELILSILLSAVISNIVKYIIENKDKNKLNTALSEYVSKDIAEEILSWDWSVNLEWEKKRIAIFFSDIEWFTNISEKFSPEKLISFLKDYLTEMSEIIFSNKWFINKYEWDAIMALRWVFWKEENISKKACETALLQKQKLIELNKKWEKKWIPLIKVRIWINSWEAIIWNIWAIWKKLEFTAIWDNVNLASRLESINKFYSTYICVSESTYADTKDIFEFRYIDKIKVKWKNIATNIYELLDYKWKLNEAEQNLYNDFQKWIDLYLNRNFQKALEIFNKLIELWDKPSLVYKERCNTYIDNPPPDSWDQSWTMTEK